MKKRLWFLLLLASLSLASCAHQSFRPSDLEASTTLVTEGGVKGRIKEPVITSLEEKVTLIIENLTETEIYYGVDFSLEVELEGAWYQVPFDEEADFIAIAVLLKAKSVQEEVIDLSEYFKKLPTGKYRIVKEFYLDGEELTIAPSFEIE